MRDAYNAERTERYSLPGATPEQRAGSTFLDGIQADAMAAAGEIFCQDPHCYSPLFFRNGYTRSDGCEVQASWVHRPGTAEDCSSASGPEGEWHRYVKEDVLAAAYAHEFAVPGARADAVVRQVSKPLFTAVEIQHSPIKRGLVAKRHAAHGAAGLRATAWILDGDRAGISTSPEWVEASNTRPGKEFWKGQRVLIIRKAWVVDVIQACIEDGSYNGIAGFLVGPRGYETVRFINRAEIISATDGSRHAVITTMTAPVSTDALRAWAAGPDRQIPSGLSAEVRTLDALPTRRIKAIEHDFLVSLNGSGTKVAVGLNRPHTGIQAAAEQMGLTLSRAPKGKPFQHRGGEVRYGRLTGPASPKVLVWLETDFGFDAARAA